MTAVVGILCKDGVVLATDSSVTFSATPQFRTVEQVSEKLYIIADRIILAGTGSLGMGQRFNALIRQQWDKNGFTEPLAVTKALTKAMIEDMASTYKNPGDYGALMGFVCKKVPHLCEFALSDFQPELKTDRIWYCSMGSAQYITDPFLGLMREIYWDGGVPPTVHEGAFTATWALEHACKVNPGGVNEPISVAVLEKNEKGEFTARVLSRAEVDAHRENIEGARQHLRKYRDEHKPNAAKDVPPPPKI